MKSPHLAGPNALLMLVAALAGCAPRTLPASFPASSAASPQAAEAPSPRIGVALSEEPPLPGEPAAGWVGLEPAGPRRGADPHQHHHHHHGPAPATPPEGGLAAARPEEPVHAH